MQIKQNYLRLMDLQLAVKVWNRISWQVGDKMVYDIRGVFQLLENRHLESFERVLGIATWWWQKSDTQPALGCDVRCQCLGNRIPFLVPVNIL